MRPVILFLIMILPTVVALSQPPVLGGKPLYFEGTMRHVACTGEVSVWGVQLYVEEAHVGRNAPIQQVRQAVIYFYPNSLPTGSYRRELIYMAMRVDSLPLERALKMESRRTYISPSISHYGYSGKYVFVLESLQAGQNLQGSMRSFSNTRGTLVLAKAKVYKTPPLEDQISTNREALADNLALLRQKQAERRKAVMPAHPMQADTLSGFQKAASFVHDSLYHGQAVDSLFVATDLVWHDLNTQRKMRERSSDTLHTIVLPDTGALILKWYDHATPYGDSISVFVDDVPVLLHQGLTQQALPMLLRPGDRKQILVTMVADNQGNIPLNTALMVVETRQQVYRLPMRSDAARNGSVLFIIEN